jgi:hypothetical protein
VVEPIKHRKDVDGCGCLRCRDLDAAVTRRSVGHDLLWSVRLVGARPSLAAFALAVAVFEYGASTVSPSATDPAGVVAAGLLVGVVVAFRGYVAAVAADELGGRRSSAGRAFAYATTRVPAAAAAVAGALLVGGLAIAAAIVLAVLLFVAIQFAAFGLGIDQMSDAVFDGALPSLLFGSVLAAVWFKFWLAPDVCVVGDYGPVESLRLSWAITASEPRRLLVVVAGFAASFLAPRVGAALLVEVGATHPGGVPGIRLLSALGRWLSSTVWFVVGTQIYVRSAMVKTSF